MFYYYAQKEFPTNNSAWKEYIQWTGYKHLRSLVTLDCMLCPCVINDLTNEDYKHNVHEDMLYFFFKNRAYLKERLGSIPSRILAVVHCPSEECAMLTPPLNSNFAGYDIMDADASISLLTNCGALPLAFEACHLSVNGLLSTLVLANNVKQALTQHYITNEHVPGCQIWAIWVCNK